MFSSHAMNNGHFCFADFPGIHTGYPHPMMVDIQHDPGGLAGVFPEHLFKNHDHEVHSGVVIVMQKDLVLRRFTNLLHLPGQSFSPICRFTFSHAVHKP